MARLGIVGARTECFDAAARAADLFAQLGDPRGAFEALAVRADIGPPTNAVAESDRVVVKFVGDCRTKDGRDYRNRYCNVFRVSNGRIRHIREYLDTDLTRSVFG